MISDFVRLKAVDILAPREVEQLRTFLVDVFHGSERLPSRGSGIDWREIASRCGVEPGILLDARHVLRPGLEALRRELRKPPLRGADAEASLDIAPPARRSAQARPKDSWQPARRSQVPASADIGLADLGPPALPYGSDAADFHSAFTAELLRRGENLVELRRDLRAKGHRVFYSTLRMWRTGQKTPSHVDSLAVLAFLEARWDLPAGYFRSRLPHPSQAIRGHDMPGIGQAERRRIAWHLPDDFDELAPSRQEEILEWVRQTVVSGATDYRRYQATAMKHRFALRFPDLPSAEGSATPNSAVRRQGARIAPPGLAAEMADLQEFKTATLTKIGYRRRGVWGPETAAQKVEHFGLFFGAMTASPTGPIRGAGVPPEALTFGLLVFPRVWDWYLRWREQRRGFFTAWESDMLGIVSGLANEETGWLTQTHTLAERLLPVAGLVSEDDVTSARSDWPAACEAICQFARARSKEIARVSRVHHDPFEPILPVLEADSPVGLYRKIADEIVSLRPCPLRYPKAVAESSRAFLMIRLGLHLGFRQKNLRQLLLCSRDAPHTSERRLADQGRGELRWSERDQGWEVFVPSSAFKNAQSTFFGGRPFRLVLPDIAGLYAEIEAYVTVHRARLLGAAPDPGVFFVKTVKSTSASAAYDQTTFFEAWRWIIQRYGIHNPYTGRGAIAGLLPHGPHGVRDVLATHVLKQTGSYEQASYAIQDTPDTVAQHYGRFLPQDKAAIAAQVLNRAWEAA
jgi:hypothetical protein